MGKCQKRRVGVLVKIVRIRILCAGTDTVNTQFHNNKAIIIILIPKDVSKDL